MILNSDIQKTLIQVFESENMLENKKAYKDFKSNELIVKMNLSSQKIIAMINKLIALGIVEKLASGKTTFYNLSSNYKDLINLVKE